MAIQDEDMDIDERPNQGTRMALSGNAAGGEQSGGDAEEGNFWDDEELTAEKVEEAATMKLTGTFMSTVKSIKAVQGDGVQDKSKRIAVYMTADATGAFGSITFWLRSKTGAVDKTAIKRWSEFATKRLGVTATGPGAEETWESAKGMQFRCKVTQAGAFLNFALA